MVLEDLAAENCRTFSLYLYKLLLNTNNLAKLFLLFSNSLFLFPLFPLYSSLPLQSHSAMLEMLILVLYLGDHGPCNKYSLGIGRKHIGVICVKKIYTMSLRVGLFLKQQMYRVMPRIQK